MQRLFERLGLRESSEARFARLGYKGNDTETAYLLTPQYQETLSHAAKVGNNEFPQAFLAQGIRLAGAMMDLHAQGLPIHVLLHSILPEDEISHARQDAHRAYNIESHGSGGLLGMARVWFNDRQSATDLLASLAGAFYLGEIPGNLNSAAKVEYIFARIDERSKAQLRDVLHVGEKALRQPKVEAISYDYKSLITDFMHKYQTQTAAPVDVEQYRIDQTTLMQNLNAQLHITASEVRGAMIEFAPEEVAKRMELGTLQSFFGRNVIKVATIDPLRIIA